MRCQIRRYDKDAAREGTRDLEGVGYEVSAVERPHDHVLVEEAADKCAFSRGPVRTCVSPGSDRRCCCSLNQPGLPALPMRVGGTSSMKFTSIDGPTFTNSGNRGDRSTMDRQGGAREAPSLIPRVLYLTTSISGMVTTTYGLVSGHGASRAGLIASVAPHNNVINWRSISVTTARGSTWLWMTRRATSS